MHKLPFEERSREILVKKESLTDERYGKRPEERTIKELLDSSVICLNKHEGPTSHEVADFAKKILKAEKCGHGGTLDPGVTGVLALGINKATKVMETLLKGGKEYVCVMHLHADISKDIILESSKKFIGKITQLPPLKSAVKRQLRERNVYYLEILEIKDRNVLFKVGCQAGTYVRTICDSWGRTLNTKAHMQELVRTKAGPFNDNEWYSLQDIKDAFSLYEEGNEKALLKILKPVEFATQYLPKIQLIDSAVDTICHGATLSIPGISKLDSDIIKDELVVILTLKNELVALGTSLLSSEEIMSNDKGLAVKITKVFMNPETYPHFIKK